MVYIKIAFHYFKMWHLFVCSLLDPPGPPSRPEVKDKTKSSISLAWKPPAKDGGSPIKGYIVEMQEEGTSDWKKVNEPDKLLTTCECVVPNLKELRKYKFRVKAVNEAGESEPSDTTGEIPATDIQGSLPYSACVFTLSDQTVTSMYRRRVCHLFEKCQLTAVPLPFQRFQRSSLTSEHRTAWCVKPAHRSESLLSSRGAQRQNHLGNLTERRRRQWR